MKSKKKLKNIKKPGFLVLFFIFAGILYIPISVSAPKISNQISLAHLTIGLIIGVFFIGYLSLMMIYMGSKSQKTTYELSLFSFGHWGKYIIIFLLGLSLLGWTFVSGNTFATVLQNLIVSQTHISLPFFVYVIIGHILFVLLLLTGIRSLGIVSRFTSVIALILFLYIFVSVILLHPKPLSYSSLPLEKILPFIIGIPISLACTLADFGSFARSAKHALGGAFLGMMVFFPFLFVLLTFLGIFSNKSEFLTVTAFFGFTIIPSIILLICTTSANASNIFQNSLSWGTFLNNKLKRPYLIIIVTILSCIVSSFPITQYIVPAVSALAVLMPPVVAIYVVDYFFVYKKKYPTHFTKKIRYSAFLAWILGSVLGFLTNYLFNITYIPPLDSYLLTTIIYGFCVLFFLRKK